MKEKENREDKRAFNKKKGYEKKPLKKLVTFEMFHKENKVEMMFHYQTL